MAPIAGIPYSDLIPDIFRGVSEVFLLSSITVGILFVIGLAVSSVWAAVFAVFGSLLAFGVASFESGLRQCAYRAVFIQCCVNCDCAGFHI